MRLESKLFAERVASQASRASEDLLYTGEHYKDVVEYITSPLRYPFRTPNTWPQTNKPFVHIYDLLSGPASVRKFARVADFDDACKDDEISHQAGLAFLTGHTTPEWLNAVGGAFDVDPLHVLEHLSFRPTIRLSTFAFPCLPSSSTSIVHLNIPTIGHIEPSMPRYRSEEIQKLRRECSAKLREQSRAWDSNQASGAAVLRRLYLHSSNTFTLEQEITVSFVQNGDGWTLLIWCDCSGDGERPPVPLSEMTEFQNSYFVLTPVVQIKRLRPASSHADNERIAESNRQQSLALLPGNYGRMLETDLAAQDPFYALRELLDFQASSELQFINMMNDHIGEEVELAGQDREDAPSLADFQYAREHLENHSARLTRLLHILEHRNRLGWPQCSTVEQRERVDKSKSELIEDFRYLMDRLRELQRRCERGTDVVLGNTNLLLAQRSFSYNQALGGLTSIGTWIAILYVPMSFLTSIFGMNFREFGQGDVSVWLWAVTSAALLGVCSLAVMVWKWRWFTTRLAGLCHVRFPSKVRNP